MVLVLTENERIVGMVVSSVADVIALAQDDIKPALATST